MKTNIVALPVHRARNAAIDSNTELDYVAVEEPLQIRLNGRDVAITMRTPGYDRELAAGFLFTEGILSRPEQIQSIVADELGAIEVKADAEIDIGSRNFYVTSSCGVCGKASIEALRSAGAVNVSSIEVTLDILSGLPAKLREGQAVFEHTGGLHAAALFNVGGELLALREDVGRHNAVDKLIGTAFLENRIPLTGHILMLSGRISFELVQKAVMAQIPVVAAVGAPSSLAVETALRFGITLAGFLRDGRCNVYTNAERIRAD